MKIAVGTTSVQKIEFLDLTLREIGVEAELIPINANSGISNQPLTLEETKKGSINRAKEAFEKTECDFGIGIEVGYEESEGIYEMFCVTTIYDGKVTVSSISNKLPLPEFHDNVLKDGKYLGDYVQEFEKNAETAQEKYLALLIRHRKDFIVNASKFALLIYLNRNNPNLLAKGTPGM